MKSQKLKLIIWYLVLWVTFVFQERSFSLKTLDYFLNPQPSISLRLLCPTSIGAYIVHRCVFQKNDENEDMINLRQRCRAILSFSSRFYSSFFFFFFSNNYLTTNFLSEFIFTLTALKKLQTDAHVRILWNQLPSNRIDVF